MAQPSLPASQTRPLVRKGLFAFFVTQLLAALGLTQANSSLLLASVFCLGVHSAFLGPLNYGILPQLVAADDLVAGKALVEMGTS